MVKYNFVFVFCLLTDLVCKCDVSLPPDKVGGTSHVKEGVSDRLQHSYTIKHLYIGLYFCFCFCVCVFLTHTCIFLFQRWECGVCVIRGWISTNAGYKIQLCITKTFLTKSDSYLLLIFCLLRYYYVYCRVCYTTILL